MIPAPARTTGVVKVWNDERGFGFAAPVHGGPDVFVHIKSLAPGSAKPEVGDTLSFEIERGPQGKPRARNVVSPRVVEPVTRPASRSTRSGPLGFLAIAGFVGLYLMIDLLRPIPWWVAVLYVGLSLGTFVAYALDKSASRAGGWRLSESSLLSLGLIGGWPGAIVAQQVFRHKTVKRSFRLLFWLTVVLNVACFALLTWFLPRVG
jgi:uncharacterized membrane protein YsdA (DUF1294 family)/cold shock CspA family protein